MSQRLGIGYGVGKGDVILVVVKVREDGGAFLLYMIKGGIPGNGINPRLEGAAFLEAFYVLPRLEESVLDYVLGDLIIMRILPGEVEDGLHVPVHQFSEGGIVAGFKDLRGLRRFGAWVYHTTFLDNAFGIIVS